MYEDNLRVPLLMRYPAGLPRGVRVEGLVDTIDLLPTIFDLAGLEAPEHADDAERELLFAATGNDLHDQRVSRSGRPPEPAPVGRDRRSLPDRAGPGRGRPPDPWLSRRTGVTSAQDACWADRPSGARGRYPVRGTLGEAERPRLLDLEGDPLELEGRFDAQDPEAMVARMLFEALREHSAPSPSGRARWFEASETCAPRGSSRASATAAAWARTVGARDE